jgi:hypothetical protein
MPVILGLRRWKWENCKSEVSLGYTVRTWLKGKKKKGTKLGFLSGFQLKVSACSVLSQAFLTLLQSNQLWDSLRSKWPKVTVLSGLLNTGAGYIWKPWGSARIDAWVYSLPVPLGLEFTLSLEEGRSFRSSSLALNPHESNLLGQNRAGRRSQK